MQDDGSVERAIMGAARLGEIAAVVPALQPVNAASRKPRDSYAWIRTKLRPGEKWKRRLPKVAW